jgi:polysaccharide biosynthesis transport protein
MKNIDGEKAELVTSNKTPSVWADAFRATLTSILFPGENGNRPRIIVITSAIPGDGKTTVVCNLALALSEIDPSVLMQSVLLIDGDLRKPRVHEIFGMPNRWGLADILNGNEPPNGCQGMVCKTAFRNLNLLPSGLPTANSAVLLHSPRACAFLDRVREEFHTVIIGGLPILNMPDARVLGRVADDVILVVRSAETMRSAIVG